ncbi:hypothetical protein [Shewanella youngdeokensis]|uniref:Uncharacterized protein n=1 Tax=Shewanella youngdeokensis TaxID=2999068 RepID=A0ABZ0K324_9GAMM|nr:hypothetical protein RGE70_06335 [Shewanella sp. DAU334]
MAVIRNEANEVIHIDVGLKLKRMQKSVVENRKRLFWKGIDISEREVVGRWVDERPLQGDNITIFKQADVFYLETRYNDGCHSLDEMLSEVTPEGLKLEDKGGNIFGDYFLLTPSNELHFCHSEGCYYTATKATIAPV